MGLALCKEYTFRYKKIHKCQEIIECFKILRLEIPEGELTEFKLCMPDDYKTNDPVESYRNYYRGSKAEIAKWKIRNKPDWMK